MKSKLLFDLAVAGVMPSLYVQTAIETVGDSFVSKIWEHYTQGNHDLQTALKTACIKTSEAIAIALTENNLINWFDKQLRLTPPKLSKEFAETIQERYSNPTSVVTCS